MTTSCGICEHAINAAPPVASGTVLCAQCAASQVLVAAYREGRARLAETKAEVVE